MTTQGELQSRRQGVLGLAWFSLLFFLVLIGVSVGLALHLGYGLWPGSGHPTPGQHLRPAGHGFALDSVILLGTVAADAFLVAGWAWLGRRLPIDPPSNSTADEGWYRIQVPGLTRALVIIGCACIVAVSLSGSVFFPVILIKYGW